MPEPQLVPIAREAAPETEARLAAFYDLDNRDKTDDIDFFRQLARRSGGPVLELAVGTGRVAIPLAKDGHRLVGLDISAARLARAREKAVAAGLALELMVGDMRDFALPEPFALILIAYNSFLFLDPNERAACLARVREHLARDGSFVLDVFQPDPDVIAGMQGALLHEWTRDDPETGKTILKSQSSVADVDGVRSQHVFDEVDAAGNVRRYVRAFQLHFLYRRELELLLTASGFTIEAMYGSYELDSVAARSPKLLAVARRRERGEAPERRHR